jgi:hypothetical protein
VPASEPACLRARLRTCLPTGQPACFSFLGAKVSRRDTPAVHGMGWTEIWGGVVGCSSSTAPPVVGSFPSSLRRSAWSLAPAGEWRKPWTSPN